MKNKKFQQIENNSVIIGEKDIVALTKSGNILTIKYASNRQEDFPIERVNKDYYIIKRENTGELHEITHADSRADNLATVRKSLDKLRDLINANAVDLSKCRWLCLTYAENMTNPERLIADFRAFNRKARAKYGHYEYVTAAEPQGRGAWHLHVLLIFDKKAPYMANDDVYELWGKGFVSIKAIKNCYNLGAYLNAYLCDMDLSEIITATGKPPNLKQGDLKTIETTNEKGKKTEKYYVKGQRLTLYPKGFHLFRTSRGVKKPIVYKMTNTEAETIVKDCPKIYERSMLIKDLANDCNIYTNKRVYNRKLRPSKDINAVTSEQ